MKLPIEITSMSTQFETKIEDETNTYIARMGYNIKFNKEELTEMLQMYLNPPLKFEELKEGMWVWDDTANWYNYITELLTIRDKHHIKFDDGCRSYFMIDFEEGRFFAREVKE